MAAEKFVTVSEISKHNSAEDCWIVIDRVVWDLTEFSPQHPGGPEIITEHAGHDATATYNTIHTPDLLSENLRPSARIGRLDISTITPEWSRPPPKQTPELSISAKPPLDTILNVSDFEEVARRTFSKKAWAYFSSAATDCVTRDANKTMLERIWFRPRLMRDVSRVSTRSTIFGHEVSMPLFISPAAAAKLAHRDGELALARGATKSGIIQIVSNNASYPITAIHNTTTQTNPTHPLAFQLYMNQHRPSTATILRTLRALHPPLSALIITIDAPVAGKREADERLKPPSSSTSASPTSDAKGSGLGRLMGSYIDPALSWSDIPWIRSHIGPGVPLVVKGVQGAADALLALRHGADGIIVSNHGGRSLDSSPPAVLALLELRRQVPRVFERMDVYVDGGVGRGGDVLKCLCLGARGVGVGRGFLWSLAYGEEGVLRVVEVLRDEMETGMRLLGVTGVEELKRRGMDFINTKGLDGLVPEPLGEVLEGGSGEARAKI